MKSIAISLSVLMVLAATAVAQKPGARKVSKEIIWEGSITGIGG